MYYLVVQVTTRQTNQRGAYRVQFLAHNAILPKKQLHILAWRSNKGKASKGKSKGNKSYTCSRVTRARGGATGIYSLIFVRYNMYSACDVSTLNATGTNHARHKKKHKNITISVQLPATLPRRCNDRLPSISVCNAYTVQY